MRRKISTTSSPNLFQQHDGEKVVKNQRTCMMSGGGPEQYSDNRGLRELEESKSIGVEINKTGVNPSPGS